ncbi:hypothetical protein C7437_10540 [Psychrobacillus insolitus]|uniref:Uncharacterized protein n=1 Tax=Psychrobacillus insolitus TaxID=1461 RepID=A0A2W7MNI9_9BACI|nr:hypothetical protein [Psychrobacillus insolitus]PZX03843.1 hypothetical protein C7437_10540 [Psychrobacillus insolitus]
MRSGFKKLFIGFLFVFLKFHIIVDLLPDFIGYILIYNGIKQLATLSSQSYDKLKVLTIVLAVVSVPNFFLNDQIIQQSEWLSYYPVLLSLLKVILVYYLFDLLRVIAKLLPFEETLHATNRIFYWYMAVNLGSLLCQSFIINAPMDIMLSVSVLIVVLGLIIEIAFLVYLRNMQKRFSKDEIIE